MLNVRFGVTIFNFIMVSEKEAHHGAATHCHLELLHVNRLLLVAGMCRPHCLLAIDTPVQREVAHMKAARGVLLDRYCRQVCHLLDVA